MNREPLIRVTKRDGMPLYKNILIRACSIVMAMLLVVFFVHLTAKISAGETLSYMWEGVFGNSIYMRDTVFYAAKLLCIAVALAPAFKMRFWNCGAEGQVLAGGLATAIVMVYCGNVPAPLLYLIMVISAIALAAVWAILPAIFKAKMGVNETLFTLMMNYVATSIVACMTNILRGKASSLGKLNMSTQVGWFPQFLGQRYNINILIVVILMFVMFFYLKYSKQGYEITVVGESENTARYAGINVKWVTIRTMIISGAICGLVGFLIVAGRDQTISTTSAGGNGFTAIIVAWLAKFNTFYMALISFLLIFLSKGAAEIASAYSLNDYAASIIEGVILFFILGSEFFINYKMIFRGSKKEVH